MIYFFIVVYTVVLSGFTVFMHYAFKTYAWDLGIFVQSFWTTVNKGQLFYYTIELPANPSGSFLGTHFSPILFLVVPIYALFQSPVVLLILQSFVLALTALPLYWIAKRYLNDKLSSLGYAVVFLLYPALHCVNCFDFHTEAFIPLFLLLSFYYIDSRKWLKGFLFTLLVLCTIEFAPILVLFLAFYFVMKDLTGKKKLTDKRILFSLILAMTAVAWFFIAFSVMNAINPVKSTGLPGNWTFWGSSLQEVFLSVITHPIEAVTYMVMPIEKVYYFLSLLAPLLMFPIFSSEFLFAIPWLVAASLSEYRFYFNVYFQYSAFAIGQLFVASLFGLKKLLALCADQRTRLNLQRTIVGFMLIMTITLSIMISPMGLPLMGTRKVEMTSHTYLVHDILTLVPNNASIATQNDIFPHVAQREHAYILTSPMPIDVDLILLDLKSSHFQVFGGFLSAASPSEALLEAISSGKYGLFASSDGIILLRKNYTDSPMLYVPRVDVFSVDDLFPVFRHSRATVDSTASTGRVIVHEQIDLPGFTWFGPYAYFFKGNYNATFKMKTASDNLDLVIDVADSGNVISERRLNSSDFCSVGRWQEFTLNFTVGTLSRLEFRGACQSENSAVSLDYVKVVQMNTD
jgi:uncharacterized membrane protein